MELVHFEVPEVLLIRPRVFKDTRGYFFEGYNKTTFENHGIKDHFLQDNYSLSAKGVIRGLHYQLPPKAQAKLVRVIRGAALDVIVDIRKKSKTFGKVVTHKLTGESKEMIYIPEGFAHGFIALEDNTEFMYKVTEFYSPQAERGILWSDPDLKIEWPKMDYNFSEKDLKYPRLKDAEIF